MGDDETHTVCVCLLMDPMTGYIAHTALATSHTAHTSLTTGYTVHTSLTTSYTAPTSLTTGYTSHTSPNHRLYFSYFS